MSTTKTILATTQLVFRHTERTSIHNIVANHEPLPAVADHQVLVKVRAVSLNYRDLAIANSTYPFPVKDSVVPCSDMAGVVVQVGAAVDGFTAGDRVIANFDLTNLFGPQRDWVHSLGGCVDGVLCEYIALPSHVVTKIPVECELSFAQLATLVCTGVTAWNALFDCKPLQPGQTVLFQGTGGVSITGLQIAKAAGAVTIITSSSDEKLQFVKETFGADHVINYRTTPQWAAEVNRITHGHGVDYVFENGGSGTIAQSIDACARGGIVSVIGFLSAATQDEMPDVAGLVLNKGCIVRGVVVGSKQLQEALVRFVASNKVAPYVHKTFGFSHDQVLAAFELLKSGQHIGKICIELEA